MGAALQTGGDSTPCEFVDAQLRRGKRGAFPEWWAACAKTCQRIDQCSRGNEATFLSKAFSKLNMFVNRLGCLVQKSCNLSCKSSAL